MTEQEKKDIGAELTDNQLDQVTGGMIDTEETGTGAERYCTCEKPDFYMDPSRKKAICRNCGGLQKFRMTTGSRPTMA